MVLSKGRDGNSMWCVASKNIRAISRSHPRLMLLCEVSLRYEAREATERSEVTLDAYFCKIFPGQ